MSDKTLTAIGAFSAPMVLMVALLVAGKIGAPDSIIGALTGALGTTIGWFGRVIAAQYKEEGK